MVRGSAGPVEETTVPPPPARRLQGADDSGVHDVIRFLQADKSTDKSATSTDTKTDSNSDSKKEEDKKNVYFWTYKEEDFNPKNYGD